MQSPCHGDAWQGLACSLNHFCTPDPRGGELQVLLRFTGTVHIVHVGNMTGIPPTFSIRLPFHLNRLQLFKILKFIMNVTN